MHNPLALIALIAYCLAALRILAYRRDGARHRQHVSWVAWLLLVVLGGSAIELAVHANTVGYFEAARAVLFAVFIFGSRGNVARLLRSA
ncbi:phage holin family protein [Paraburkholderia guartelaensis]|uniref:Phage holin family protein n=1 Tax=Paraburkholderia guartelaensis TaxID=2546446 RepID=A0ABU9SKL1_9BURK